MITKSYSQSGQDRFVDLILKYKLLGTFLDIGANHPIELSNTYALEKELGWTGTLVERDAHCIELLRQERNGMIWPVDALEANWAGLAGVIDYLSLDCDENTAQILDNLLKRSDLLRFRVLTVETDAYRFGPEVRDRIDLALKNAGYDVLCRNVRSSEGMIYESWAVDPKLVDMENAERFRSDGLKWSEILAK